MTRRETADQQEQVFLAKMKERVKKGINPPETDDKGRYFNFLYDMKYGKRTLLPYEKELFNKLEKKYGKQTN